MDFSDIKFNNPIESNSVQKSVSIKMPWNTIHCISSGIDDLFGNTSCLVHYTIRFHRVNGIYYDGFFSMYRKCSQYLAFILLFTGLLVWSYAWFSIHFTSYSVAVSLVYSYSFTLAKFPFGWTKRVDILMKSSFSNKKAKHRTQQPMPCISWRINQWINLVIACKIQTMRFGIIKTVQSPNATYKLRFTLSIAFSLLFSFFSVRCLFGGYVREYLVCTSSDTLSWLTRVKASHFQWKTHIQ